MSCRINKVGYINFEWVTFNLLLLKLHFVDLCYDLCVSELMIFNKKVLKHKIAKLHFITYFYIVKTISFIIKDINVTCFYNT